MITGQRPRAAVSFITETVPPADGSTLVQRVYPGVAGGCWLIPQGNAATIGCLFFPEASSEHVGDQRQLVREFAAELGVPCGNLRGAPVPTGDDALLRSEGGTYFVGDAAGLAESALGAGIHLAIQSARKLADALAGGVPYEDAMTPAVARLRDDAGNVASASLRLGIAALMKSRR